MATKEHVITAQAPSSPGQITVTVPYEEYLDLTQSLTYLLRRLKDERRDVNRRLTTQRNEELLQANEDQRNSS